MLGGTLARAALGLALAFPAAGGDRDGAPAAPEAALRPNSPPLVHFRIVRALRDSRDGDAPPSEQIVASLAEPGTAALAPLLDILVDQRLPALLPTEREQMLSVPQRGLLLAALARGSSHAPIPAIESRLEIEPTVGVRIAALHVYSEMGDAHHLGRVLELALSEQETELDPRLEPPLRATVSRILVRDPGGFRTLGSVIAGARAELRTALVFALGATRDPRGVDALAHLLAFHPELAGVAVAQVRQLGRSCDPVANRRLAEEIRPHLGSERAELCCAAARALGELGDAASVPRMIELLEAPSPSVRDSALWALRRSSRLAYPALQEIWRRWYEAEQKWWETQAPRELERAARGNRSDRLQALQALSERTLHREELAARIAELLSEDDEVVRRLACDALGRLGSPAGSDEILRALRDAEEGVRLAARSALSSIHEVELPEDPEDCRRLLRL